VRGRRRLNTLSAKPVLTFHLVNLGVKHGQKVSHTKKTQSPVLHSSHRPSHRRLPSYHAPATQSLRSTLPLPPIRTNQLNTPNFDPHRLPTTMLVLFESAVGLCLFKIKDGKLDDKELHKQFDSPEGANNL
jgi:hypothetical protein